MAADACEGGETLDELPKLYLVNRGGARGMPLYAKAYPRFREKYK